MSKAKLYLKKAVDLLFGTVKPISGVDCALSEEIIFQPKEFHMPEFECDSNNLPVQFAGYEAKIPAFYVRSISNAFCFTNREEVFSSEKKVILEYTSQKVNPLIGTSKLMFYKSPRKKVNAVVAHLSLSGLENNYYHFLTECLARLYLLEKSTFKPEFYIISKHLNFQKEFLSVLGITEDRVIPTDSNLLLEIKTLIVPDLINNWEEVYYRGFKSCSKQWQPSWLVNLYREKIEALKGKELATKKILISREKANYRHFSNQQDVNLLFQQLNFEIHYLEELTVLQQIELFSNAKYVAGIHGAGLINLYFSRPGVKLFEIYPEYYHDSSYRVLSTSLGISHTCFVGQTLKTENIHPQKEDVFVNIEKLQEALTKFLN